MTVIIINDCKDVNAAGRQIVRAQSLLHASASFVGVQSDLEAAGNIIDALDALDGRPGIILANVAPRNGGAKKWPNGTPFGYFWYGKTLVVASVDGYTWSLIKKLNLTQVIQVLYTKSSSQFRSFEFLPRVAARLVTRKQVPYTKLAIQNIPDAPTAVWWIDNFGNCKTTLLPDCELRNSPLTPKTDIIQAASV